MYSDLLLHTRVRWLSREKLLKRFAAYLEEMKTFMSRKDLSLFELQLPEWLEKLHFMVDMTSPEHAEHNSSGEKSNSATHAGGGVGV